MKTPLCTFTNTLDNALPLPLLLPFPPAGFALAIPDLDGLITLIGAVASAALAFIFPPVLELLTFWSERPPFLTFHLNNTRLAISWWFTVAKCLAILLLGVVGSLSGTIFSIISIVQFFKDKTGDCSCPSYD